MEIQSILIFALIGAVAMIFITGGVSSMMDEDASSASLAGGATLGAALGAAFAHMNGDSASEALDVSKHIMEAIGASSAPTMKVGLPNF